MIASIQEQGGFEPHGLAITRAAPRVAQHLVDTRFRPGRVRGKPFQQTWQTPRHGVEHAFRRELLQLRDEMRFDQFEGRVVIEIAEVEAERSGAPAFVAGGVTEAIAGQLVVAHLDHQHRPHRHEIRFARPALLAAPPALRAGKAGVRAETARIGAAGRDDQWLQPVE